MDLQAALPVSSISTWRLVRTWARAGPLKFGEEDLPASAATGVSTAQAACHAPASVSCDRRHGLPIIFWMPREGRVLISAQIAAGYALTSRLYD